MQKTLLVFGCLLGSIISQAQPPKPFIPLMRKIFHDNIDKSQKYLDKLDRKEDKSVTLTGDPEINQQLSYAVFKRVDDMQDAIEMDSTSDSNKKIRYLRGLNEILSSFEPSLRKRELKPANLPELINAYNEAMKVDRKNEPITPVIDRSNYFISNILLRSVAFEKNVGIVQSRELMLLKSAKEYPRKILSILAANPNVSFADSLLQILARFQPDDVYNYAQSGTELGDKIRSSSDPLIKTIVQLAGSNQGRMYFPFLDNLYRKKITIDEIEKQRDDEYKYYRLLVNTEIEYAERLRRRDTPMALNTLSGMLRQKAIESFINEINGLHDSPDNIRMKKVEPLNPQELYYLCVMGENEIYTSSYLKVYDRIFQRMKNPNSDTLLLSVNFDRFKKFIRMAANYNTLNDFLKRMNKGNAEILMRAFANGLEKTGNLEDAVDVADSYASISDPKIRKLILDEVGSSLNKLTQNGNKRGIAIYDLLSNIFQSLDSTKKVDLAEKFGIPPIYSMDLASLKDSSGRIIIQQFFYGDKSGIWDFKSFRAAYSNANWRIVDKQDWIEVSSTKGTPVTIYSNKPLDELQGLDEQAQESLNDYLREIEAYPTVVIHRGHSYHVSSTIDQLFYTTKVVLLGSCGGYQNVNRVLSMCPYAHIIASKQVGSGTVNQPMILYMTERMRSGKDLNWPLMWKEVGAQLKSKDLFEDYIPPYKNLGALFLMAYNRLMDM